MKKEKVDNESIGDEVKSSPETGGTPHDGLRMPMWQTRRRSHLTQCQSKARSPNPRPPRSWSLCWPSGRTNTCGCRPSSTTTASVRSRRRWIWCRPAAATCYWRCSRCAMTCSGRWRPWRRATTSRRCARACGSFRRSLPRRCAARALRRSRSRTRSSMRSIARPLARFAAGEEMKGKVIDVVQTGYMLGERVLRFAKVVVGE